MPIYIYTAAGKNGGTTKGKISAPNEMELEQRLGEMDMVILGFKVKKEKKGGFFGKIGIKDLIMFCVHLEQLDRAGVPLLESLADLRDTSDSPKFKGVMSDIYESVKGGEMLSAALAKKRDIFGDVFIGLVAAGEETGNMSEAFGELAEHIKWNSEFRRKMKKAIKYPIALLVVMSIVITIMMLFVVPQLIQFMQSQGFELPIYTRALIATSDAFVAYWYLIFGIPLTFIIMLVVLYKKNDRFRHKMDGIFLKTPAIGQVILKMNMARFSHFFAITFSSGIGVLECLDTGRKVVGNMIIKDAITDITQLVSEGNSIAKSIALTEKFPSLVVRMFRVGEESGNMDAALHNINFFYDREVEDSVNNLIGVIQPTLTLMMGILMFWIIAAVFGPLYQSFSKISF